MNLKVRLTKKKGFMILVTEFFMQKDLWKISGAYWFKNKFKSRRNDSDKDKIFKCTALPVSHNACCVRSDGGKYRLTSTELYSQYKTSVKLSTFSR